MVFPRYCFQFHSLQLFVTLIEYDANISHLLTEVETLKEKLGEANKQIETQRELNQSLSEEIIKKAETAKVIFPIS